MPGRINWTALCASESSHWLSILTRAALDAGFAVLSTDSAAHAIALCADHRPDAALLHEGLLYVDQWSTAEQLHMVSAETAIILVVENPADWELLPSYVAGVTNRDNLDGIASRLRRLRDPSQGT